MLSSQSVKRTTKKMEKKIEEEPKKQVITGARKRKSTTVTRLLINKVPITNKLKSKKPQKSRLITIECDPFIDYGDDEEPTTDPKEPEVLLEKLETNIAITESPNIDNSMDKSNVNVSIISGPPFACVLCEHTFHLGSKLKLHYVINHFLYHCETCTSLFDTEKDKNEHTVKMHSFTHCQICKIELNSHDLIQHYALEHDATQCKFCPTLLQPKSSYASHFFKKHRIRSKYIENANSKILTIRSGDKKFYCCFCERKRGKDVFLGHMRALHKVSVAQLLNIVVEEGITIAIEGTTGPSNVTTERKETISVKTSAPQVSKNKCTVCSVKYTANAPAAFHHVYCNSKIQCSYCSMLFDTSSKREMHLKKWHTKFMCTLGCEDISFLTEDLLNSHYLTLHKIVGCRYCDIYISSDKLETHLMEVHEYKANIMKNFTETLFEVSDINNQQIVICCLCEDNITPFMENLDDFLSHYDTFHMISIKKVLRLVSSKPLLSEYADFYKEIDNSIETGSNVSEIDEVKITGEEKETGELNNKENETSNKADKNEEHQPELGEDQIISDFDPQDIEGILDIDDENEGFHRCEICDIDNIPLLDFLIHLKDKHRIVTKYKEHECRVCFEILLGDINLYKHLFGSHQINEESIETYQCGCRDKTLYKCLARDHILAEHRDELERHDVGVLGHKCRYCDDHFWELDQLNLHEVSIHFENNETDFLKCFVCLCTFSNQNCLRNHAVNEHPNVETYSKLNFKCLHCTIALPSLELMRDHFSKHHPSSMLLRCPHPNCCKLYKVVKFVRAHLSKPHRVIARECFDLRPCAHCGARFRSHKALSGHKMIKHRKDRMGLQCRLCKEKFKSLDERKFHYKTVHPGHTEFSCVVCGKGFNSKSGLYGHKRAHIQGFQIACPYCSKEFTRRDSYSEHLLIHVGPKHPCPHCSKMFTQRSNLVRHIRIHTGSKPYICSYCGKSFSDQGAKRSHERVHTKEEHCECTICGKKFTKRQKLKYHMKFHTGEGLVNCDVCDKKFSNNYTMQEHRRIHEKQTQVMCECGRAFSNEKYLSRHQTYVHGKEAPRLTCPICFKVLFYRAAYNSHIMTHSSTKHVRCLLCNVAYHTRRTVRRHLVTKHKLKPTDDLNNHIHQLTPEEAGVNIPAVDDEHQVNISQLLDEADMLDVDIQELECFNGDTVDEVSLDIKAEPVSEDAYETEDDTGNDDSDDEDYVAKKRYGKSKKEKKDVKTRNGRKGTRKKKKISQ